MKTSFTEEKSAVMPFGSETLLSQLVISSNTGSNILTWNE